MIKDMEKRLARLEMIKKMVERPWHRVICQIGQDPKEVIAEANIPEGDNIIVRRVMASPNYDSVTGSLENTNA